MTIKIYDITNKYLCGKGFFRFKTQKNPIYQQNIGKIG